MSASEWKIEGSAKRINHSLAASRGEGGEGEEGALMINGFKQLTTVFTRGEGAQVSAHTPEIFALPLS